MVMSLLDSALDVVWNNISRNPAGGRLFDLGDPPQRSSLTTTRDNLGNLNRLEIGQIGFRGQGQADELTERMELDLIEDGAGPSNVRSQIIECFSELATNAVQHSQDKEGCFGTLYYNREMSGACVFAIGVVDKGIGIRKSLESNDVHRIRLSTSDDSAVIDYATQHGVTGTNDPRGIGLFSVKEAVQQFGGKLQIISGNGCLIISNHGIERIVNERFELKGTMVLVALHVPELNH